MWLFSRFFISTSGISVSLLFFLLTVRSSAIGLEISSPDTIRIEKEIIFYDTVYTYNYIYDTVYVYDTIFVDVMQQKPASPYLTGADNSKISMPYPLLFDTISFKEDAESRFYAEVAASAFLFRNIHAFKQNAGQGFRNDFAASLNPQTSYALDARIAYKKNRQWLFASGISYVQFNEKFSYQSLQRFSDTTYLLNDHSYYVTTSDTVTIYQADALLNGDSSIYVNYIYSYQQWVQQIDTAIQIKDSMSVQNQTANSKWSYLEIPFLSAYRLYFGALEIDLEGGLIPGLLISSGRTLLYEETRGLVGKMQAGDQTIRFSLNASLGANFSYPLTQNWQVLVNPWIKFPLIKNSHQSLVNSYTLNEGLRIGIRYQF